MACGCIARQKRLVEILCRNPNSPLCLKAKARLERMQAKQKEAK